LPEGHTLHRLAGDLLARFGGHAVRSSSPQGRFAAERLDGRVLTTAEAHGKHLLVGFADVAEQVHIHLGLYGTVTLLEGDEHPVVGQVRWRLATPDATADLRGPTACELLDPDRVDALVARLGPDPLRADADPERAWVRVSRSRTPVAALLMDQSVLAGVGNVYRAEVLFRHGLDPMTPGRDLDRATWDAIWSDLVGLMHRGVATGRIDTVRPEHEPEAMGRPPRQDDHGGEVYVYRRGGQDCLVCGTTVVRNSLAQRSLFWCPTCQNCR
jgi:formamidopyrimidine-DNA glycosylase